MIACAVLLYLAAGLAFAVAAYCGLRADGMPRGDARKDALCWVPLWGLAVLAEGVAWVLRWAARERQ